MKRRITAGIAAAALAGTMVVATADAGNARDTGWDCPGCKIVRR